MKKLLCKISAVIIMIILLPVQSAFAHTLTVGGKAVEHYHFGYCGPLGCPVLDSKFESSQGFKATDKIYSGTHQWNCHGRTFDNKQSWVNSIQPYLPTILSNKINPSYGDPVIFFKGGIATHSATIVGPWNGTNTIIMSKYGKQGQYKHALSNSIKTYGWTFGVTALSPNIKIYTASNGTKDDATAYRIQSFLREREKMPWYKDILEAKKIYETEHPKFVARSAKEPLKNSALALAG